MPPPKVNRDTIELRDRFPWQRLQKKMVVDVGGGSGHISMYLAGVCSPLFVQFFILFYKSADESDHAFSLLAIPRSRIYCTG
jgi:hypothetical protein